MLPGILRDWRRAPRSCSAMGGFVQCPCLLRILERAKRNQLSWKHHGLGAWRGRGVDRYAYLPHGTIVARAGSPGSTRRMPKSPVGTAEDYDSLGFAGLWGLGEEPEYVLG